MFVIDKLPSSSAEGVIEWAVRTSRFAMNGSSAWCAFGFAEPCSCQKSSSPATPCSVLKVFWSCLRSRRCSWWRRADELERHRRNRRERVAVVRDEIHVGLAGQVPRADQLTEFVPDQIAEIKEAEVPDLSRNPSECAFSVTSFARFLNVPHAGCR